MHYSKNAFWRPLFEDDVTMLQLVSGCSHNRCHFCDMYHQPFCASPMEEVEADILEIEKVYLVGPKRIFLTGGNAFCLPADKLLKIANMIHEHIPTVQEIGCFARVTDIARKNDEDLQALAQVGFDMISIGAESGWDEALAAMDKGFTSADIINQATRLDEAGIRYAFFYLAGIAGKGKCIENARRTAEVFGQTNPAIIMIHTMSAFPGTLLHQEIEEGAFARATEKEIQQELREFYALYPKETFILGAHYANTIAINAKLPQQRQQLLDIVDDRIGWDDEEKLEQFRASLKTI